jgi:hypothetical protein
MVIKLEPSLSACIETVAKKEYEKVLSVLLGADREDPKLAGELELLRLFLESANFCQLRSSCDEFLLAGRRVKCSIKSIGNAPGYEITIKPV